MKSFYDMIYFVFFLLFLCFNEKHKEKLTIKHLITITINNVPYGSHRRSIRVDDIELVNIYIGNYLFVLN